MTEDSSNQEFTLEAKMFLMAQVMKTVLTHFEIIQYKLTVLHDLQDQGMLVRHYTC